MTASEEFPLDRCELCLLARRCIEIVRRSGSVSNECTSFLRSVVVASVVPRPSKYGGRRVLPIYSRWGLDTTTENSYSYWDRMRCNVWGSLPWRILMRVRTQLKAGDGNEGKRF